MNGLYTDFMADFGKGGPKEPTNLYQRLKDKSKAITGNYYIPSGSFELSMGSVFVAEPRYVNGVIVPDENTADMSELAANTGHIRLVIKIPYDSWDKLMDLCKKRVVVYYENPDDCLVRPNISDISTEQMKTIVTKGLVNTSPFRAFDAIQINWKDDLDKIVLPVEEGGLGVRIMYETTTHTYYDIGSFDNSKYYDFEDDDFDNDDVDEDYDMQYGNTDITYFNVEKYGTPGHEDIALFHISKPVSEKELDKVISSMKPKIITEAYNINFPSDDKLFGDDEFYDDFDDIMNIELGPLPSFLLGRTTENVESKEDKEDLFDYDGFDDEF